MRFLPFHISNYPSLIPCGLNSAFQKGTILLASVTRGKQRLELSQTPDDASRRAPGGSVSVPSCAPDRHRAHCSARLPGGTCSSEQGACPPLIPYLSHKSLPETVKGPRVHWGLSRQTRGLCLQSDLKVEVKTQSSLRPELPSVAMAQLPNSGH